MKILLPSSCGSDKIISIKTPRIKHEFHNIMVDVDKINYMYLLANLKNVVMYY